MLNSLDVRRIIDWSEVALDCGYFDQSHLIRDCRLLAGFTPQELNDRRRGNTLHIAL
jgi:AraC-like DNA-binding protein